MTFPLIWLDLQSLILLVICRIHTLFTTFFFFFNYYNHSKNNNKKKETREINKKKKKREEKKKMEEKKKNGWNFGDLFFFSYMGIPHTEFNISNTKFFFF
jgi:predicted membrane protein